VREGAGNALEACAAALDLFQRGSPPTAIFASTDIAALSAIRAARDAGLRVPRDVAIIGAGDIIAGEYSDPPLTTVGPESRDFSDVAQLVFSRLHAPELRAGRRIVKRWELKKRGSA
jgi:DNA-binding LacI/PurR family transcriptional regulator